MMLMTADLAAAGTFAAGSEVVTLPASNLGTPDLARLWRAASGVTAVSVTVDLGSAQATAILGLLNTNLTAAATFRVRTSNNSNMSSPDIDTGVSQLAATGYLSTAKRQLVFPYPAASTRRYVRIDMTDASLPWIEAGKLVIGPGWTPQRGYAFGWSWDWEDLSESHISIGGQRWVNVRPGLWVLDLTLQALTQAEGRAQAADLISRFGAGLPFLLCLDTASSDRGRDSIWGTRDSRGGPQFIHPDIATMQLRLTEWR